VIQQDIQYTNENNDFRCQIKVWCGIFHNKVTESSVGTSAICGAPIKLAQCIRLYLCNNSRATEWIFLKVKFDVVEFYRQVV
jgi:hypothetical protein